MSRWLGGYLQRLRQAKGVSTRSLASSVSCHFSYIARIETGERAPGLNLLWRIVTALDGDFGTALYLLCLDSGVPEDVAERATSRQEGAERAL